jgi:hypothetical protein
VTAPALHMAANLGAIPPGVCTTSLVFHPAPAQA